RRQLRLPIRDALVPTTSPFLGSSDSGRQACASGPRLRFPRIACKLRPVLPWMGRERLDAIRIEKFSQFPALLSAEAGTNSDVLQGAAMVKESQEQRADESAITLLVPATSCHDTVAVAPVLHLKHHACGGFV